MMRFVNMRSLSLALLGFLLSSPTPVEAKSDVIYTSSVEFCGTNQLIRLDKVDFRFYPQNSSVEFSIMANSISNNVNALLNFQLIAYGLRPVNVSVDLCNVANGLLCPLPVYNYNGTATYIIPQSYTKQIPSIAYYLPDLEARAELSIIDQTTGQEAACIIAHLSNGLTANHNYVSWAVGAVILIAFLTCLVNAIYPISAVFSGPDYRLWTAVTWLQHIVITGMISVNYPAVFQAFTRNFSWVFGLIYIAPLENDTIRKALATGGLNETRADAITISSTLNGLGNANAATNVQGATADSAPVGIEQYVEKMALSPATAFITSLVVFLILAAIMLALVGLVGLIAFSIANAQKKKRGKPFVTLTAKHWVDFAALNALRWFMVVFMPLTLLAAFTFRFESVVGYAFVVVAAVTFVLLLLTIFVLFGALLFVRRKRRDEASEMYQGKMQRRLAPLIEQYKEKHWFASGPLFVLAFIQAIFVGAGQRHPYVQLIPLIVIEAFILIYLCVLRPFQSKGSNALTIILSIGRLVSYALLIPFLPSLNVNRIVVTVIGIVILVIQSVLFLVIFAVILKQLILGIKWAIQTRKSRDKRASMLATVKDTEDKGYMQEKEQPIRDPLSPPPPFTGSEASRPISHASSTTLVDSRPESKRFSAAPDMTQQDNNRHSFRQSMHGDNIAPQSQGYIPQSTGYAPQSSLYQPSAEQQQQAGLSSAYNHYSRPGSISENLNFRPTSTYQ